MFGYLQGPQSEGLAQSDPARVSAEGSVFVRFESLAFD